MRGLGRNVSYEGRPAHFLARLDIFAGIWERNQGSPGRGPPINQSRAMDAITNIKESLTQEPHARHYILRRETVLDL